MKLLFSKPILLRARLIHWVMLRIAPQLPSGLTIAVITFIISLNLDKAAWVPDSTPFIAAAWVSFLIGLLLTSSRFSGLAAILYHGLMAFLSLGLWIGKILPGLNELSIQNATPVLHLANIRLFTYLDRLASWVTTSFSGGSIQDNGLFQLFIGLLIWACMAWLTWAIFRRGNAYAGLLPTGLLLGINTHLSGQSVEGLWLFFACAALLATKDTIHKTTRSWEQRQIDYPDELGWSWGGSALALSLIILVVARLSPWVGTSEGWKTLADVFRDTQKRLEDTTTRLFGDVAPPPTRPDQIAQINEPPAPRADTPEMGSVGLAPYQSSAVVMWVKTSDPPPPEPDPGMPISQLTSGPIHYWRSSIFGNYTGTGWEGLEISLVVPVGSVQFPEAKPSQPRITPENEATLPDSIPGRYLLEQEFEIAARHGPQLFAVAVPARVGAVATSVMLRYAIPDGSPLVFGQESTQKYTVQSWATAASDAQMRGASSLYPPEITAIYLQLPSNLPQRVRDLTRRVVSDAATPYDKAVRIQDYLRLSYQYNLQVPLPPAGRDVVDFFLFDSSGGFCSYYSSAMAVMLRSLGIPARVASGYAMGSFDFSRRAYRVSASNAHAWTEVYFPGFGWIEFEPTAGLERIRYETTPDSAPPPSSLPSRPIPPASAWQSIALAVLAVLMPILLFGLAFWRRARRQKTDSAHNPAWEAEQHYFNLRRWLAWAGLRAPPSATPNEYLLANLSALQGRGPLITALEQATILYQQAVFSAHPITLAQVIRVRDLSKNIWVAWLRLFVDQFRSHR